MALTQTIVTRQDEARTVLTAALAAAPDDRARGMTEVQLGWVASKQGKPDEARRPRRPCTRAAAGCARPPCSTRCSPTPTCARTATPTRRSPRGAVPRPRRRTPRAWAVYARILVALGDHAPALAAATKGLELSPRDPDLLRSQATALAALGDPQTRAAEAAYARFRGPDNWATLRIACAKQDVRCQRERNAVPTIAMH